MLFQYIMKTILSRRHFLVLIIHQLLTKIVLYAEDIITDIYMELSFMSPSISFLISDLCNLKYYHDMLKANGSYDGSIIVYRNGVFIVIFFIKIIFHLVIYRRHHLFHTMIIICFVLLLECL